MNQDIRAPRVLLIDQNGEKQGVMPTSAALEAAEEAGRDPDALECIVCAPSHISDDIADAREQVRWFPAMVSNHVMDLIERKAAGETGLLHRLDLRGLPPARRACPRQWQADGDDASQDS